MGAVEIFEPDPQWARDGRAITVELMNAAGGRPVRVDHIGSTSVPGLAAKDVLDMQVTVVHSDDLDRVSALLEAQGWEVMGAFRDHLVPGLPSDEQQWVKRLLREPAGRRRMNVHVRIDGRANQSYALLFRDYLRSHPATAVAYGRFKKLAARLPFVDVGDYADLKDPVCDLVYLPAQEWAVRTGWAPPPAGL